MPDERRFRIRPRHLAGSHARVLTEVGFEAAAVAFIEDFAPAPDTGSDIVIHVLDLDSGLEHCFHVDLESGATAPCSE